MFKIGFLLVFLTASLLFKAGSAQAAGRASGYTWAAPPLQETICTELDQLTCWQTDAYHRNITLPDLETLPPSDLKLFMDPYRKQKLIRFSNSIVNRGDGVLELRGRRDLQNNSVIVNQNMFSRDSEIYTRQVGEFEFHQEHGHWHWVGFSQYEIRRLESNGDLGKILATSGKVGYCLLDIHKMGDEWIEKNARKTTGIAQRPQYGQCHWERQGISVGWQDTYRWNIPGQTLDISRLEDGVYALLSTVDPDRLIHESEKANNTTVVYFLLQGDKLQLFGEFLPEDFEFPLPDTRVSYESDQGIPRLK